MNRRKITVAVATVMAMALTAGACSSDRDDAADTTAAATTAAPTSAPATTSAPDTTTASSDATDTTDAPTDTSTADSDAGTASTDGTTPDTATADSDTATTEGEAEGPMFGDAPWPCGPGSGANKDDGSEVGVTAESVAIAGGDDAGFAGAPGLDHEMTDAMRALVAKCNELGGINGRQITFNYYDASVFNAAQAVQGACDGNNFFMVGEGYSFDGNQEETRLACGMPAVPGFAVSAAFSMGKDVFQGLPNPADETPAGFFAQMARLEPDAVKNVATLAASISSTIEPRDKTIYAAPNWGWGFNGTNLEYNPAGEADWTPFVKQVQDSGASAAYFVGTCLPGFQLFAQAAKANSLDITLLADTNFYEAGCAAANTDGAMDGLYVHTSYIPFEEADVNQATQDYLDLINAAGGDVSTLGLQSTTAFLLWATAASDCGDTLTRACVLENLKNTHEWTGHGLHASGDVGGNHPTDCQITLQLRGSEYTRVAPEERGTFECQDDWVASVAGVPALAAAKLDANRISQQFATGG